MRLHGHAHFAGFGITGDDGESVAEWAAGIADCRLGTADCRVVGRKSPFALYESAPVAAATPTT